MPSVRATRTDGPLVHGPGRLIGALVNNWAEGCTPLNASP